MDEEIVPGCLVWRGGVIYECLEIGREERGDMCLFRNIIDGIGEVDFLLPEFSAAIECDGAYWHSSLDREIRDGGKDQLLTERGIKMLRLGETEIKEEFGLVAIKVCEFLFGKGE